MNIVLLGPPGCGKGTQAAHICEHFNLKYFSVGNELRKEIHKGTEFGKKVGPIINAGNLIPSELTNALVKKNIPKRKGIVFDGYPRAIEQATALDEFGHVDVVLLFEVPNTELIKRLSSRWMVEVEHKQFTFTSKTKAEDFVKYHGGNVFRREDDTPEHVKHRLDVYDKQTKPLIEYYGKQHKLFFVHGDKPIGVVWREIRNKLTKLKNRKV